MTRWSSLPASFPDGTVHQSFWDYGDGFPTQSDDVQWYYVDFCYTTNFVAVPVNPGASGNFSGGAWSGSIAVPQAGTGMMLLASAGDGYSYGLSNPFDVLGTPKLAIAPLGSSIVISWPVAAEGFNLEQSSALVNPTWAPAPGTSTAVGARRYVTNALSPASVFYRLHKP